MRRSKRRVLALLLGLGLALLAPFAAEPAARGQQVADDADLPLDPIARLEALDRRLAGALSDVERATRDAARVEAELGGITESRAAANRRLRDRARSLYRMTRAGVLPLAGGFDALLSHLGRVERLERMVRHDADALRELRSRSEALRAEAGRLAGAVEEARARAARLEAQKAAIQEDAQRAATYAAAFGESLAVPTYDPATGYGLRVLDPAPAAEGFEAQRGELALPLSAPRAMRQATREDGQGLELDGARGASVRAAAGGRVAFSDRHPAYGRLVIVDHGGGFFTVYGGLARADAAVGDHVSRGMAIGEVDGEPLFFQVRRGTRALDARGWLGI